VRWLTFIDAPRRHLTVGRVGVVFVFSPSGAPQSLHDDRNAAALTVCRQDSVTSPTRSRDQLQLQQLVLGRQRKTMIC